MSSFCAPTIPGRLKNQRKDLNGSGPQSSASFCMCDDSDRHGGTNGSSSRRGVCENQTREQERDDPSEGGARQVFRSSRLASYRAIPQYAQFHRSSLGKGRNAGSSRRPKRGCQSRRIESMVTANLGRSHRRPRRHSRLRSLERFAGLIRRAQEANGCFTGIQGRTGKTSFDERAQNERRTRILIGRFLTVRIDDVAIKSFLQSLDVFSLLRTVMGRSRMEERLWA